MEIQKNNHASLGRCVLAGLIAGSLAGALASLTALILMRQFNQTFNDVNWFSVCREALLGGVIGGFVYAGLARCVNRPGLWFVIAGLAIAAVCSGPTANHLGGLVHVAGALHFVVAITVVLVIPALARALPRPSRK